MLPTTSTDESSQNNAAPESRELLSTFNPTMLQQVQQNINNSSQDENRQNNAASQSSEIQSNAIIHQNQVVPPVEVLRQRGTHIDGAQQASTSTASGEVKPNLYATETTESPQHHNTDTKHRNESINIGQESMAAQEESNRFREQSSTIQDSTDGSNDIGQESMTAQEESESSRKQLIRAMWSYYTHDITCRSPSFDIQIRRDFSNQETRLRSFRQWTGYHILDPGDLSLFYYLKGPGYNVKCWKCHESIYIHEGMENISKLAREIREGRPILCSCAKRLRLLALLLAL
ncbi:E3 ubiquitin-protein ligase XIAP [Biomphalaria pfeifferi]|uniref:E3 ubiquitin-protein ligase XIAP n=1 Tax=Biomphalaria pfeifferi TaxID=112525 RepID=A0AAD8C0N6_BIOPF|nr:E3 ubiquitin-protein ligase XIAP [Biomphalaria pfeifferi]